MFPILISALLFGLIHPGAKWIMSHGLSLLPFCLLFVGIRLVAQIPVVFWKGSWRVKKKSLWRWLLAIGLAGAGLQITEFCGISDGLPVGVVSFLVYTHPIWTILLSRLINQEPISRTSIAKLGLAVVGVALITGFSTGFPFSHYFPPVLAGFFIALWISLSNRASKEGCSASSLSFYYDAFSFVVILAITVFSHAPVSTLFGPQTNPLALNDFSPFSEVVAFLKEPHHFLMVTAYSLFMGFLPNYLFYCGSKVISTQTAGFTLLLEPLISTLVSHYVWSDPLTNSFLLGALLILSTNIPSRPPTPGK